MNNKFEQHLKQALDNYQANYNSAHWEDMNKRLDKLHAGKSSSLGKTIGIAAGVVATAGLIYFFSTNNSENKQPEKINTTAQNVTVNNNETKQNPVEQKVEVKNEKPEVKTNDNSKTEKAIAENKTAEQTTKTADENKQVQTAATNTQNTQPEQEPLAAPSSLSATFHFNQPTVCAGTAVQFNADNTVPCTYRWDFGDGKTSGEINPKHTYAKAGAYIVKLHLTSTKDKTSDEQKNTLTVNPVPNIDMNYSMPDDNNPSLVSFEAKDGSIKEWNWDFGDKQSSTKQNPIHEYKKGSYDVIVTATNTSGCNSTSRKLITIENEFPLAPTAFSPNGDGRNDTWMPASFANGDYNFTLTIIDKTETGIYKTSDKNHPWDGGNAKPGERFTWKASVKDKNGKETNYSGVITIVD